MRTIKGPALFLAQFVSDEAPFNSLENIARWAGGLGYKGVQIPSWDGRVFDLERAASDLRYCAQVQATLAEHGLVITELSTHLQGQLVAVHPAYDQMFDGFAPESVRNNPVARQEWAVQQMLWAARALEEFRLNPARQLFRGAIMALYVSLATASSGFSGDGL